MKPHNWVPTNKYVILKYVQRENFQISKLYGAKSYFQALKGPKNSYFSLNSHVNTAKPNETSYNCLPTNTYVIQKYAQRENYQIGK